MHLVKLIKNDKMSKSKVYVEENLWKKILRHINSVKEGIGEFSENKNEFGEVAAKVILKRKCNMISAEEYIDFMSKYMLKELDSVLKQYKKSPQIVGGGIRERMNWRSIQFGYVGFKEKNICLRYAKSV